MIRNILASIFIMATSAFVLGQSKYKPIRQLAYTGYYNWGFIWINVGNTVLHIGSSDVYPHANKIAAYAATDPSWEWFFVLRDTLISHHDKHSFGPIEFYRSANEGDYAARFRSRFSYDERRIYAYKERIGKYTRYDTLELADRTYDMLSIAWKARELDFDSFEKGHSIPMNIFIDEKIYNLDLTYLGEKTTKVGGKKYKCYVFSPQVLKGKVFKDDNAFKIWVTKDDYRIPVLMEAKIRVGSLKAIIDLKNTIY